MMNALVVMSALLACLWAQPAPCCNVFPPTSQISFQQVTFVSFVPMGHKYCQTYDLGFAASDKGLRLAPSLSNYKTTGELDIQVYARVKPGTNIVTVTLLANQQWTNIKVSVFASARPDVFVGTFYIDTSSTFNPSTTPATRITLKGNTFVTPWTNVSSYKFLGLYFSGGRGCNFISTVCLQVSMDPTIGYIEGSVTLDSNARIQFLEVTYILSLSDLITFTFFKDQTAGGVFNLPVISCFASGIPKISSVTVSNDRFGCTGLQCPAPFVNSKKCTELKGTIIQCKCVICEPTMILVDKRCVCAAQRYLSLNFTCLACWADSQLRSDQLGCNCVKDTVLVEPERCGPASGCLNAIANLATGLCECAYPAVFQFRVGCTCASKFKEYDPISRQCRCNGNSYIQNSSCIACWNNSESVLDRTTCKCKAGFVQTADKKCDIGPQMDCGKEAKWNGTMCVCLILGAVFQPTNVCSCLLPTIFDAVKNVCLCPNGSYLSNQICLQCWDFSVQSRDGQGCTCLPGYLVGPDFCVPKVICNPSARYDPATAQCVCGENQILDVKANSCSCKLPNQQVNLTSHLCTCVSGFFPKNSVCTLCWKDSISSKDSSTCVCKLGTILQPNQVCASDLACSATSNWNAVAIKCTCIDPQVLTPFGCRCPKQFVLQAGSCVCGPLAVQVGGKCLLCPANGRASADRSRCICDYNYFLKGQYCLPIPTCATGSVFDLKLGDCRCLLKGLVQITNKCDCPSPFVYDPLFQKCVCPLDFYLSKNACQKCWNNSRSNSYGSTCDCNPGFYNVAFQKCDTLPLCPINSRYDVYLNQCVCVILGQQKINDVCSCPSNSVFNSKTNKCDCTGNNFFIDPQKKICVQSTNCTNSLLIFMPNLGCVCALKNANFDAGSGKCLCDTNFELIAGLCVPKVVCVPPAKFDCCRCRCPDPRQTYANGCQCPQNMVASTTTGGGCVCDAYSVFDASGNGCVRCASGALPTLRGTVLSCSQVKCDKYSTYDPVSDKCICVSSPVPVTSQCTCRKPNEQPDDFNRCICAPNYYYFTDDVNKQYTCVPCQPNSHSSTDRLSCICDQGFTQRNKFCVKLSAPLSFQVVSKAGIRCASPIMILGPTGCQCPPTMLLLNDNCICANQTVFKDGVCTKCPENFTSKGGFCECAAGLASIGDVCAKIACKAPATESAFGCTCPNALTWSPLSQQCECSAANRVMSNGNCVCSSSSFQYGLDCLNCPSNSVPSPSGKNCSCAPSYVFGQKIVNGLPVISCSVAKGCGQGQSFNQQTFACDCTMQGMISVTGGCICPSNMEPDTNGVKCVCSKGYFESGSGCVPCGINSQQENGVCTCLPGYIRNGSECVILKCDYPNRVEGMTCICFNQNQHYDPVAGTCLCVSPKVLANSNKCQCPTSTYSANEECKPCWPNSAQSATNESACECLAGYNSSADEVCSLRTCGALAMPSDDGTCKCVSSQLGQVEGVCMCLPAVQPPQLNQSFVGGRCICPPNSVLSPFGGCTPCFANSFSSGINPASCLCSDQITIATTDTSCDSLASIVNQQVIVRSSNPNANTSRTKDCPKNTQLENGKCECDAFSINVSGTCQPCGPYSYKNTTKCVCFANYYEFKPNACKPKLNCVGGALWDDAVKKCVCNAPGLTYKEYGCACEGNLTLDPTINTCICLGKNYIKDHSCVPCMDNSVPLSDYSGCRCVRGFVLRGGICETDKNCLLGANYSAEKNGCVCVDTAVLYDVNAGCLCTLPNTMVDPSNPGRCVCDYNSYASAGKCLSCSAHAIPNLQGTACLCIQGYVSDSNNGCVQSIVCAGGAKLQGTNCVCNSSFLVYHAELGCICAPNSQLSNDRSSCLCDSTSINYTANGCSACAPGTIADATRTACICAAGYYRTNKTCTKIPLCIPQAYFSEERNRCLCFLSLSPTNDGCNCAPLSRLLLKAQNCSCFLEATPPSTYFIIGCSTSLTLLDTKAQSLVLKTMNRMGSSYLFTLCGQGNFNGLQIETVNQQAIAPNDDLEMKTANEAQSYFVSAYAPNHPTSYKANGCFQFASQNVPQYSKTIILYADNDSALEIQPVLINNSALIRGIILSNRPDPKK